MTDGTDSSRWVRCIVLATKRPDMTQEEFDRHWSDVHGAIARHYPNVVRYSQLRLKGRGAVTDFPGDQELPVHGIVDFIYTAAEDIPHIWESPAGRAGVEDSANFLAAATEFYVDEHVQVDHLGIGNLVDHPLQTQPALYP
jgi:uncharacterized protein (TIGR02118 family)